MRRVFDAPKHLVFEAWSKAEYVSRWFTPAPLTTPSCEVDLRTGGVFHETDATRGANAGWTMTLNQLADHVRART
jgi:uncharacterized protein YndB with AHSA1/START domain